MYCENCFRNKLPQKGTHFLVFGDSSQSLYMHKATKDHTKLGFTPHIITVDEVLKDGRFKLHVSCGVVGCGWSVTKNKDDESVPDCIHARTIIMEALEYAALKKYRDDSYYLD
jgi:hypothetical protein